MQTWLARLRVALRSLILRRRVEEELDEELAYHLERQIDEGLRAGLTASDARASALREMGAVAKSKEECRDVYAVVLIDGARRNVRDAVRSLRRTKSVTLAVIATFALAIGVNAALFSVIHTVLLRPLPFEGAENLVWITEEITLTPIGAGPERRLDGQLATADLWGWRNEAVFDTIAGFSTTEQIVAAPELAWQARIAGSSEPPGALFGVSPATGRDFLPEEVATDAAGVALLSHETWVRRFGGDPDAIGTVITIGEEPHTIVGVMPPRFRLPLHAASLGQFDADLIVNAPVRPTAPFLSSAIARLRPGDSIASVGVPMAAIMRTNDERGETFSEVVTRELRMETLHERVVGNVRFRLLVLWGAVGFVLLIACANVASLLLARSGARTRDAAIRAALGAGRGRLIAQHLTESVALALMGGAIGTGVAALGLRTLVGWMPLEIPRLRDSAVDATVLSFALFVCAIVGIVSGLAPAFVASGTRPSSVLRNGGSAASRWRGRLQGPLVVAELALALVLTLGAGLMVRSMWQVDASIEGREQVFVARVETVETVLPNVGVGSPDFGREMAAFRERQNATIRYLEETIQQIEALPGVTAATFWMRVGAAASIQPRGLVRTDGSAATSSEGAAFIGDYVAAAGMRLRAGRTFDQLPPEELSRAWIVNEAYLRPFGLEDLAGAVGMPLDSGGANVSRIVGVVSDFYTEPDQPAPPQVLSQITDLIPVRAGNLWVRTSGDPTALAGPIQRIVTRDLSTVMIEGETLADQMASSVAPRRFQRALFVTFAAIALVLALVGTYGVLNYTVSERTREIGVRIAIGAERRTIMRMVLARGFRLGMAGIGIGIGGALALDRIIESLVFGVPATDAWTYLSVCGILLAVALAAASLPALRAIHVDPVEALRHE